MQHLHVEEFVATDAELVALIITFVAELRAPAQLAWRDSLAACGAVLLERVIAAAAGAGASLGTSLTKCRTAKESASASPEAKPWYAESKKRDRPGFSCHARNASVGKVHIPAATCSPSDLRQRHGAP